MSFVLSKYEAQMHKIELIILRLVNLAKMLDLDPTSIKLKSALRVSISPMYLKVVWSETYFDNSLARWKKIADNLLQFFLLVPS